MLILDHKTPSIMCTTIITYIPYQSSFYMPTKLSCMVEKSLKGVSFSYVGSSTSLCGCLLVLLDCLRSSTHKDNMGAGFMILLVAFLVTNCITYCLCSWDLAE